MKIKKISRKPIIILILTAVVMTGYLVFAWLNKLPPFPAGKESFQPGGYIVNMERTEAEKKASEDLKNNPETKLQNKQNDTPEVPTVDQSTGKQQVNVLLTNAGIFNNIASASGMVTNVVEQGGLCRFVFKNSTNEVVKTTETMQNSSSTACKTAAFPASELPQAGTWKVYIEYSSSSSEGVSSEKEFYKG